MQALQLQSWLLDRLMAFATKHRLLEEVLTEKKTQLTPEQAEFFNKNIPAAGAMSYGLMQAGGGKLNYPDLFGVLSPTTSESEVHHLCPCCARAVPGVLMLALS